MGVPTLNTMIKALSNLRRIDDAKKLWHEMTTVRDDSERHQHRLHGGCARVEQSDERGVWGRQDVEGSHPDELRDLLDADEGLCDPAGHGRRSRGARLDGGGEGYAEPCDA